MGELLAFPTPALVRCVGCLARVAPSSLVPDPAEPAVMVCERCAGLIRLLSAVESDDESTWLK